MMSNTEKGKKTAAPVSFLMDVEQRLKGLGGQFCSQGSNGNVAPFVFWT